MLQAFILGLVQGLTEFLPVSSSGHLVIIPYLLSWEQPPLPFTVALHFGTILAVLVYFASDLWWMATRMVGIGSAGAEDTRRARRTVGLLLIGSVPAAFIGLLFGDFFDSVFAGAWAPRYAAGFLFVTAGLLYLAEHIRRRRAIAVLGDADVHAGLQIGREESTVTFPDALTIGVAQAFAIFPGVSRAGSTIATGMLRGLSREAAARFSFLLSIPVILGASALKIPALFDPDVVNTFSTAQVLVGMLTAAVSGWWAIRFLLRMVSTDDLTGFARYVVLFAIATLVATIWLGPAATGRATAPGDSARQHVVEERGHLRVRVDAVRELGQAVTFVLVDQQLRADTLGREHVVDLLGLGQRNAGVVRPVDDQQRRPHRIDVGDR